MRRRYRVLVAFDPRLPFRHQIATVSGWRQIGLVTRLVLSESGRTERLVSDGADPADLLTLPAGAFHPDPAGIALPRLSALMALAEEGETLLAVRAGIYPLVSGREYLDFWARRGPVAALTAEGCILPELVAFADVRPRRDRLAALLVSPGGRRGMAALLAEGLRAPEDLTVGGAWWDLLIPWLIVDRARQGHWTGHGAPLGAAAQGGPVLAGSGLLTLRREDEAAMTSFSSDRFCAALKEAAAPLTCQVDSLKAVEAARAAIEAHLSAPSALRDWARVRALAFRPVRPARDPQPAAQAIAARVVALAPSLTLWEPVEPLTARLATLAERMLAHRQADLDLAMAAICRNRDHQMLFCQRLAALYFCESILAVCQPARAHTTRYPSGNLHRKTLDLILGASSGDRENLRRCEIAKMFATEMVDHAIFNPRLYNYLLECCETGEERAVLRALWSLVETEVHDHAQTV